MCVCVCAYIRMGVCIFIYACVYVATRSFGIPTVRPVGADRRTAIASSSAAPMRNFIPLLSAAHSAAHCPLLAGITRHRAAAGR